MKAPVVIVPYDPRWPRLYKEEESAILGVIGKQVVAIEHTGSTAAPSLAAKPIIDIIVAVARLADAEECVQPLEGIDYEYVPEHEDALPERRYFRRRGPTGIATHHLHMVEHTSDFWQRHLLFRDFLRANPEVARQYEEFKRALAAEYGTDRAGYTEAKTPFIRSVEQKAHAASKHTLV